MSFQSSILNMIHTTAAGLKAAEFVKNKKEEKIKVEEPQDTKKNQAPKVAQQEIPQTSSQIEEPEKVKDEPIFLGGQQLSPEIAARVRAIMEKNQAAEASMVLAQAQKRAKRTKTVSNDPAKDLIQFKHLGMEAML